MAEYPILIGSGVEAVEGESVLVADDGLLYYQDSGGNRVQIGASLGGVVTAGDEFAAIGHLSPDDGSGGAYVEHVPGVFTGAKALVWAMGPASTDDMHPGNFAFSYDVASGEIVFTALDDDGNVVTGSVTLS